MPPLDHRAPVVVAHREDARHVHRDLVEGVVVALVLEPADEVGGPVVDDDADVEPVGDGAEPVEQVGGAEVGGDGARVDPVLVVQRGGDVGERCRPPGRDDDVHAASGQLVGVRRAETLGGAEHEAPWAVPRREVGARLLHGSLPSLDRGTRGESWPSLEGRPERPSGRAF